MGSYQDFLEDITSKQFTNLNLYRDQRDIPDTYEFDKGLLLPLEPNTYGLLLRLVDHSFVHVKVAEIDGMQFNWPVNDSEGYILQLRDGRRILLKKDNARIGEPGKLEPAAYLHYNAQKQFVLQLKLHLGLVKRSVSQGPHVFESPIWVRSE